MTSTPLGSPGQIPRHFIYDAALGGTNVWIFVRVPRASNRPCHDFGSVWKRFWYVVSKNHCLAYRCLVLNEFEAEILHVRRRLTKICLRFMKAYPHRRYKASRCASCCDWGMFMLPLVRCINCEWSLVSDTGNGHYVDYPVLDAVDGFAQGGIGRAQGMHSQSEVDSLDAIRF